MLDTEMHRTTGRTVRMLEHAIEQAKAEKRVCIFGKDMNHAMSLGKIAAAMLTKRVSDEEEFKALRSRILVLSFNDVTQGNLGRYIGQYRNYDYRLNRFVRALGPQGEEPVDVAVVIDHYALETHLADVLRYLRTARSIADHTRWLIDTARMMSVMGRRTYVVTEDPDTMLIIKNETQGFNVMVEDGVMLGNLNLLNQEMRGAHPSGVLLIDPKMLHRHFDGAIREMNRWNKQ